MKGKALEKFQEYVYSKYEIGYYQFLELPLVCQQALWVEFFESVGIYVYSEPVFHYGGISYFGFVDGFEFSKIKTDFFKTRPEALSKAIEKAILKVQF